MVILINHVAVSNAADATLTWKILVSSPSAASRKDCYGDLPLHMALAHEAANDVATQFVVRGNVTPWSSCSEPAEA